MLDETSARELLEWQAYEKLEPFGDDWRQSGMICAQIWNTQLLRGEKPFQPERFMPLPVEEEDVEPQTVQQVNDAFACGGILVVRKSHGNDKHVGN